VNREDVLEKQPGKDELSGCRSEQNGRVSTGIKYLDDITQGGFLCGRTYLVSGTPGTGKSIFSLQFLMAGLAEGDHSVYVCVNERPEDVVFTAKSLGWDLEPAVSAGKILFLDMSPFFSRSAVINHNRYERRGTDVNIRKFLIDLDKYARNYSAKRLIIDSINLIMPGTHESRAATAARELVISIEQYLSCTTLLTFDCWKGSGKNEIHPIESYVSGVINLQLVEKSGCFDRVMWLKKVKATVVGSEAHKFIIEPVDGITGLRAPAANGRLFAREPNDDRNRIVRQEVTKEHTAVLVKE